jgi:rSAM/selenodomain-associated transferase 1
VLERLIVFTRYPEPGRVKTRLIPMLGPAGAAQLHQRLTAETLLWANTLAAKQPLRLEVNFDGGTVDLMAARFGSGLMYVQQVDGDLGAKLIAATGTTSGPTVVIGTDCPDLGPAVVQRAFEALRSADLVLGPASDGGYYLIGLNRPIPEVFIGVPWGTGGVCRLTQQIATNAGLSVTLLDVLDDIDVPGDLERFNRRVAGA